MDEMISTVDTNAEYDLPETLFDESFDDEESDIGTPTDDSATASDESAADANQPEETPAEQQEGNAQQPAETPAAEPAAEPENAPQESIEYKDVKGVRQLPKAAVEAVATSLGVSAADIVTLLQKGGNYDHAVTYNPDSRLLAELAAENGMDLGAYRNWLRNQHNTILTERETQRLRSQYPDGSDQLIRDLAKRNVEQARAMQQQREAQARAQGQQEQKSKMVEGFSKLYRDFPEIKGPEGIPKEVMDDIRAGAAPSEAYLRYQNRQAEAKAAETAKTIEELNQKIRVMEQNGKNRAAASPSAQASAAEEGRDDFLRGFFSE